MVANVRIVHEGKEPRALARNCSGAIRGNDIIGCALEYNGIQIDRWIGRRATLRLPADPKTRTLRLGGAAPESLRFTFPFALRVRIDGTEHAASIAAPGAVTLEFARAARRASSSSPIPTTITPSSSPTCSPIRHSRAKAIPWTSAACTT